MLFGGTVPQTLALTLLLVLQATTASLPNAHDVVDRYIAARGGREKMAAIHSVIYRGRYTEGEHVSDHAAMSLMRPYYKLVGDAEHRSDDFAEGYDGSAWEFYGDPGIVVRTVRAASAAGRHATDIDGPLVAALRNGWDVKVAGIENVGDRRAYVLTITMNDGFVQQELVDTETSLLIAERKAAPIHAFGEKVRSEERIGDYRDVAGVLFPFAHHEVEIATGRVLNEMQWTSIVANSVTDEKLFSPPDWNRTPLQRLLEQLYAERTDADAALWTYRDFRRAQPGVDTHDGIAAIGYQMLKMGDVEPATRLLEANAADYPNAANAAFGLGRAYEAGAKLRDAEREYRRTLTLDPTHARAKAALERLAKPAPK
jgi:hypothetical protein